MWVVFTIFIASTHCASSSYVDSSYPWAIEFAKYEEFDWSQKVKYFNELNVGLDDKKYGQIILSALNDEYDSVTLAALKYAYRTGLSRYRKDYLKIASEHYNPSIRLWAMRIFQILPVLDEEVDTFFRISKSEDWIVREKAYQILRLFAYERRKKKYYEALRSRLFEEKNPNVLKELFKTLIWYDKKKSFRYLYNRSLRYQKPLTFIFMLRELSAYSNRRMLVRFKRISKKHPDFLVREEAARILEEVYKQ